MCVVVGFGSGVELQCVWCARNRVGMYKFSVCGLRALRHKEGGMRMRVVFLCVFTNMGVHGAEIVGVRRGSWKEREVGRVLEGLCRISV